MGLPSASLVPAQGLNPDSLVIRAAVDDTAHHRIQLFFAERPAWIVPYTTNNSTHPAFLILS
jgi:hypothetical protein